VRIGGFLPLTLSDFPGHTAAIVFAQGCNFRCPFCHNGDLLPEGPGRLPETEVLAKLEARRGRLSGVVLSGGEPTLQPDLPDFCAGLKGRGLAVKLDTNGSQPAVLRNLLAAGLLDSIAMDVKAPPHAYARLAGVPDAWPRVQESLSLIAESGIAHLFRTTVVSDLLDERNLAEIRRLIPDSSPYVRQPFRPELALDHTLRPLPKAARDSRSSVFLPSRPHDPDPLAAPRNPGLDKILPRPRSAN
jgi:pyruvate formate lyase activating enzyme